MADLGCFVGNIRPGSPKSARASAGTPTHYHAMAEMGGVIYSIGGQLSGGSPTAATTGSAIFAIGGSTSLSASGMVATNYMYNGSTWSTRQPMPTARGNIASVYENGKIHVLGGVLTDNLGFHQYDIATDSWVKRENPPTPRYAGASGYINGYMYLAAGYNNSLGTIASVEAYPVPGPLAPGPQDPRRPQPSPHSVRDSKDPGRARKESYRL